MKKQLHYLWQLSAGLRCGMTAICLTGMLNTLFALGFVYASKRVVDIAVGDFVGSLLDWALITIALLLVQLLTGAFESYLLARLQVDGQNKLRYRLFDRLLYCRWNELEHYHTGDLVNRIQQDSGVLVSLLTTSLPSVLVNGAQLFIAIAFFCYLDPYLPWVVIGILPLFLLGARVYVSRMKRFTHAVRQSESRIQSVIQEIFLHRAVVMTFEREALSLERLGQTQSLLRGQVMRRTRFSLFSKLLTAFAFSGGYLTAFLWGAVRLSAGTIGFGTMTAFLQLVGKVQRPILDLARVIPSMAGAMASLDRLLELEMLEKEERLKPRLFTRTPHLELRDVCFHYPSSEASVLERYSCRIPAGTCVAIVGETGRGKTTFMRLLLALLRPDSGQIVLCDSVGDTPEAVPVSSATRCNFVYVPQGNTLFSGTIRDNLLWGCPSATDDELREALSLAAADFVYSLEQGLNTVLTENGGGLSEGQAQRIAIARALLRPGRILLFDEATSALDKETERTVIRNLRNACAGKTLLFITHHTALAEACEQVVEL